MIRWKYCLLLGMLLLLPKTEVRATDEEEERENEENDDEEDDDDEEYQEASEKPNMAARRRPPTARTPQVKITRTTKKTPLECYVCGYRSEMPLKACLDPTKYRVHSVTCLNTEDNCFTSVTSKDKAYVSVIRGCKTGCVSSSDTTCCERNRCNNQAFAMPVSHLQRVKSVSNDSVAPKAVSSNVLFFVTVLLLLQTVVKVPFV